MGGVAKARPNAGNGDDGKNREQADDEPKARPQALKQQRPLAPPDLALKSAL